MKIISFACLIILIGLINSSQKAMGYDDQIAHPTITEYSVKNSALNNHLTQYLGADFINGFESWVSGKSVLKWIVEGSIAEDADACQRANHMHNPMNNIPWSSS